MKIKIVLAVYDDINSVYTPEEIEAMNDFVKDNMPKGRQRRCKFTIPEADDDFSWLCSLRKHKEGPHLAYGSAVCATHPGNNEESEILEIDDAITRYEEYKKDPSIARPLSDVAKDLGVDEAF